MELSKKIRNILIIYPHWHPANLAGVHRPRLIGNFLPEFGWHPIIITTKEEFFEEKPDTDFAKTFRDHYEVHRVNAFNIGKVRLVGDIGLRSFFQLYKEAKKVIETKNIEFIWIPVPSYYPSILGRLLNCKYQIPYGIDYIDPWVRSMDNYPSYGMRQRFSLAVAKFLEPIAVKNASLISGVSKLYYSDVIKRNFKYRNVVDVEMPYGFDPQDHNLNLEVDLPWSGEEKCIPYVYAGAFLPNSKSFFHLFFRAIKELKDKNLIVENIRFFFLGTGNYPGQTIQEMAKEYELENFVVEKRQRFPFLHILSFLNKSVGVLAIGSPAEHYTASKIFQSVLSKKPVFAFFHEKSSVVQILNDTNSDHFLVKYNNSQSKPELYQSVINVLQKYFKVKDWRPNLEALNKYSAKESTRKLTIKIEEAINS